MRRKGGLGFAGMDGSCLIPGSEDPRGELGSTVPMTPPKSLAAGPGAGGSPEPPVISVVVVFYRRKEFLGSALASLTQQTLPAHKFEILVVGPTDPAEFLPAPLLARSRFVASEEVGVAGKVAAGLRAARASLVTFLEDDDRYEPPRLEYVVTRFAEDEALCYVQNGYRAISESGQPSPGRAPQGRALARWTRRGPILLQAPATKHELSRLVGIPPGFNISSIAVRTEWIKDPQTLLGRMDMLVDTTLLYAALTHPGHLLFDPIPLTAVRVHATSLSNPNVEASRKMSMKRDFLIRSGPDFATVHDVAAKSGFPAVVRASQGHAAAMQWLLELRGARSRWPERARALLRLSSRADTFEVRNHWPLIPLAALALVSPTVASAAYGLATAHR